MNKEKRYHSLLVFPLLTIFIITVFTIAMQSQSIFASGITIYSPYWMNYEKDLKLPYFKYCGIFDSCLGNDIRIFPFLPLTSQVQNDEDNNIGTRNTVSNNIGTRNTLSSKDLKLPYFKYCGIFDSCLGNDIRIFPFLPLTSQVQNDKDNNIVTRNTVSNNIGTRNTLSSIIPFQLPFP